MTQPRQPRNKGMYYQNLGTVQLQILEEACRAHTDENLYEIYIQFASISYASAVGQDGDIAR